MLKKLLSWRRNERGVVAIEYAFLALPFFMLLMGMLEMGIYFGSGIVLEGSSSAAARLIRTGQAQHSANPETTFKDKLCTSSVGLLDCTKIQYQVINMPDGKFASAASKTPTFDANGNLQNQGFSTGGASDVVLIRVTYKYEFITPFMGPLFTGSASKDWLTLMSTMVLKAEPYDH